MSYESVVDSHCRTFELSPHQFTQESTASSSQATELHYHYHYQYNY